MPPFAAVLLIKPLFRRRFVPARVHVYTKARRQSRKKFIR